MSALARVELPELRHPSPRTASKPRASLMLLLRSLSDEQLEEVEQYITVFEQFGIICEPLQRVLDLLNGSRMPFTETDGGANDYLT